MRIGLVSLPTPRVCHVLLMVTWQARVQLDDSRRRCHQCLQAWRHTVVSRCEFHVTSHYRLEGSLNVTWRHTTIKRPSYPRMAKTSKINEACAALGLEIDGKYKLVGNQNIQHIKGIPRVAGLRSADILTVHIFFISKSALRFTQWVNIDWTNFVS
jgi:hypothetical protein